MYKAIFFFLQNTEKYIKATVLGTTPTYTHSEKPHKTVKHINKLSNTIHNPIRPITLFDHTVKDRSKGTNRSRGTNQSRWRNQAIKHTNATMEVRYTDLYISI